MTPYTICVCLLVDLIAGAWWCVLTLLSQGGLHGEGHNCEGKGQGLPHEWSHLCICQPGKKQVIRQGKRNGPEKWEGSASLHLDLDSLDVYSSFPGEETLMVGLKEGKGLGWAIFPDISINEIGSTSNFTISLRLSLLISSHSPRPLAKSYLNIPSCLGGTEMLNKCVHPTKANIVIEVGTPFQTESGLGPDLWWQTAWGGSNTPGGLTSPFTFTYAARVIQGSSWCYIVPQPRKGWNV